MGYLDNFFNDKARTPPSLSHLKEELDKQNIWIRKIHSFSADLHSYTREIDRSNAKHKKEIIENINTLSKWIDYLNSSHNDMKKDINDIKRDIRKELRMDFERYHTIILDYVGLKLQEEKKEREDIKRDILDEMKDVLLKKETHSLQKTAVGGELDTRITNQIQIKKETLDLTNPEKEILNLLFNEGTPMTYDDMAIKLGKSVNSIRVYLNSLKSKRDMIEEFKKPGGVKIFSIKNSEMVKTLFNIV